VPIACSLELGGRRVHALDNCCVGSAATFANGKKSIASLPLLELVKQCRHELRTSASERVAKRHGAPVHVELLKVGSQSLAPSQGHRRKGLVDLVEVHVLDL